MPFEPPSPNLQTDPEGELLLMRAEEAEILTTYEWTDRAQTSARVPIERAMELLLETRTGAEAFGAESSDTESLGTEVGNPATADGGGDEN